MSVVFSPHGSQSTPSLSVVGSNGMPITQSDLIQYADACCPRIRADLVEKADSFSLYCDLPGVSKEDVDVHVDGKPLVCSARSSALLLGQHAYMHRVLTVSA